MNVTTHPKIALAGIPNCGKTALFNALTGSRQKVGNYPGVTVERKEGVATTSDGRTFRILDLPGTYSLDAQTPDEIITRDILLGRRGDESAPETLIAVCDATNLERNLGLILELRTLKRPLVLALNMMDLAEQRGLELDLRVLERELGIPVIPTVATKKRGIEELLAQVTHVARQAPVSDRAVHWRKPGPVEIRARFAEVDRILGLATRRTSRPVTWTDKVDRVLLHPVWGLLILFFALALMFQAVFNWARVPADMISAGVDLFGGCVGGLLPAGALNSLLVDGVIAGVGAVLVFLPQILLLFAFILLLEDSGYMARAAFLMDRLMGKVGLHGRAFIPLLSSYACAIPGIMATRTIGNPRDRLSTIMVLPLATCSARIPVYTLLIGAFIPNVVVWGPFRAQGLVMMGLYAAGVVFPLLVAFVLRRTVLRGPKPPLLIELPGYKVPSSRNLVLGLLERARLFLQRAGTVILGLSVILWFLAAYPKAPANAPEPAIHYSYAGKIGHFLEPVLSPLGFDWRVSVALVPGFAAREVMVSALGTVYAVEEGNSNAGSASAVVQAKAGDSPAGQPMDKPTGKTEDKKEQTAALLSERIKKDWPLASALSLMAWYIFAPQCLSTFAVTRRETNSWRWPLFMVFYLTVLAYVASFATYHLVRWLA